MVKYCDEDQASKDIDDEEDDTPNYHLGCMFLVFRIAHESFGDAKHRDFALVRRLKPAPRHNDGRFPGMASELRVPDLDLGPTKITSSVCCGHGTAMSGAGGQFTQFSPQRRCGRQQQ